MRYMVPLRDVCLQWPASDRSPSATVLHTAVLSQAPNAEHSSFKEAGSDPDVAKLLRVGDAGR